MEKRLERLAGILKRDPYNTNALLEMYYLLEKTHPEQEKKVFILEYVEYPSEEEYIQVYRTISGGIDHVRSLIQDSADNLLEENLISDTGSFEQYLRLIRRTLDKDEEALLTGKRDCLYALPIWNDYVDRLRDIDVELYKITVAQWVSSK